MTGVRHSSHGSPEGVLNETGGQGREGSLEERTKILVRRSQVKCKRTGRERLSGHSYFTNY